MGEFQSGQMGQTVNLLALRLRRFESFLTHNTAGRGCIFLDNAALAQW